MQIRTIGLNKWYDAYIERIIPKYAFFSLISCFVFNCIIYWSTQILCSGRYHYDFTTGFDRAVPFRPEWVIIYIGSFLFWGIGYAVISRKNTKEFWFRFVTADLISRVVCGAIFVILPTTNVRPELADSGFFNEAMKFIHFMDQPYNLFPSIHCLVSIMCYLGVMGNKKVSRVYRIFALGFAILIFISTQLTKQHYIVDIAGGVAVAAVCFYITKRNSWYKGVMRAFDKLNQKVFGEGTVEDQ